MKKSTSRKKSAPPKSQPQSITVFNCLPNPVLDLINEFADLRDLWMTCRELWQSDARREVVYLNLTLKASNKFYEEETYRDLVKSRVVFPKKQISLTFQASRIRNVNSLGCVHTLDLSGCRGVTDVKDKLI